MRACAHRRCVKQRLPHAASLFFLSRLSARRALRCGSSGRGYSAAIPGAAAGRAIVRKAAAGLVSNNCARAVADHVPRCCGAQRSSTAVDAEQALTLDRRLVPMPTRSLFATRLRSRSVDGVWRALLAGSVAVFKEWRGGCLATGARLRWADQGLLGARDKTLKSWDNSSGKKFLIGGEPLHRFRVCGVRWCFDLEAPRGISTWPEPAGRRAFIRKGSVDLRQQLAARDVARAWHEAGPRALAASSIQHFRPAGFDSPVQNRGVLAASL